MRLKNLLLLLSVSITMLTVNAQEGLKFPVSGQYKVSNESVKVANGFNTIHIENMLFSLHQNEVLLQTFKLMYTDNGDYYVEEYFPGDDVNTIRDKKRFAIHIDGISEKDCFVTIIYNPDRQEKIHLVKSGM